MNLKLVLRTALLKLTDAEKAAINTVLQGGTIGQSLSVGGMTEASFDKIYLGTRKTLIAAMNEGARLAFDQILETSRRVVEQRIEDNNRSLGIVPWAEVKARKAPVTPEQARRKPRKKAAIARARVYPRADLSLDEWAAKITSVIQKIGEKEMKLLQSHERVTFEEWRTL